MKFQPLIQYRRVIALAIVLPVLLCLVNAGYFYLKESESQKQIKIRQIQLLSNQLNINLGALSKLLKSMSYYASYFDPEKDRDLVQLDIRPDSRGFYSWQSNYGRGQIYGYAEPLTSDIELEWQLALSFGPTFHASNIMLTDSVSLFYMSKKNFVYEVGHQASPADSTPLSQTWQRRYLSSLFDSTEKMRLYYRTIPQEPGSEPVTAIYHPTRFKLKTEDNVDGLFGVKVKSKRLNEWLARTSLRQGSYYLLGENNQVLACSYYSETVDLDAATRLPKDFDFERLNQSQNEFFTHDGLTVYRKPLQDLPWSLVYVEKHSFSNDAALIKVLNEFVILVLLIVGVVLMIHLFSSRIFVQPATRLVKHIESNLIERNLKGYIPPVSWRPWFERVSQVFADNQKLLHSLQQHNQKLDNLVEQKTNELKSSYVSKERNLALLHAIINNLPDHIYFKNIDGSFLGCNRHFEKTLGMASEEIVGRTVTDILPEEQAEEIMKIEEQVLNSRQPFRNVYTITHANGGQVVMDSLIQPFYGDGMQLLGIMGIARDITEQQNMMDQLQKAKALAERGTLAKSRFIANMSHEIRTPMNAVFGMLQMMHSTRLSAEQKDYLCKAENSAHALLNMINDVLDFSKAESGKLRLTESEFDLTQLITQSLTLISHQVTEKHLEIKVWMDPRIPETLIGDNIRLAQVLNNLLSNAAKFTHQGQISLLIRLHEESENKISLQFSIEDTGIGIDPVKQASLFDAFTQADDSTTRRFGGTGLGLSISKQIVELMGGNIKLCSQPNQGSRFEFDIQCGYLKKSTYYDYSGYTVNIVTGDSAIGEELQEQFSCLHPSAVNQFQSISDVMLMKLDDKAILVLGSDRLSQLENSPSAIEKLQSSKALVQLVNNQQEIARRLGIKGINELEPLVLPIFSGLLRSCLKLALQSIQKQPVSPPKLDPFLTGVKVLLVDDNPINLQIAEQLLKLADADIVTMNNGEQAVTYLKSNDIDLVLMDIQMPVMDGFTATRIIRQELKLNQLPVIAITAHATEEDKQKCFENQMSGYVAKPIIKEVLYNTIKTCLPTKSKPVFDYDFALEQFSGNQALLLKLLRQFADKCQQTKRELTAHFESSDWQNMQFTSHNLKGMAGSMGFAVLSDSAKELEHAIKQSRFSDRYFDQLIEQIDQAILKVELHLSDTEEARKDA